MHSNDKTAFQHLSNSALNSADFSTVPADVGARALLLLGGGRLLSAQPELRDHQEAGVS